ncbi:MAG: DUF975 family protein [bacterium]|nr:DUF975 family protein [bacterium]
MNTFSVKEALTHGWSTFKSRPWIFVQAGILLFLINVAVNLVQTLVEEAAKLNGDMAALMLGLVSMALGIGVSFLISMGETAFFLRAHDKPEDVSLRDLWHPHPFWKFLGTSLLAGLMILGGLILLIVPGIIVGLMLAFVGYIVIEENLGPIDAIKRSVALTKGNRWKLFQLSLSLVVLNILGLLALLVGLFVTIPISFIAMVYAYQALKGRVIEDVVTVESVVA